MTSESSPIRKALACVTLAVLLFAAVVVQLTVVNRLPFPGAATPDLVLLLVAAIAVVTAPAVAAITGFAGGLALDIAPPAAHYVGEYALVFCVVGYAASRIYRAIVTATGEPNAVTAFTIMAVATAAGEAGKAALGKLLSEPDVTTAAVRHLLPTAVVYDLLLSPLAFLLVAWIARGTIFWRPRPERSQRLASAFRQASVGAVPRLRLAGTGAPYGAQSPAHRLPDLRLAGSGQRYVSQYTDGRVPKLPLAGSGQRYVSQPLAGRVPKLRLAETGKRRVSQSVHGRVPNLRLAGSGREYVSLPVTGRVPKLRLAGSGQRYAGQSVNGRVPNLRLAGSGNSYVRRSVDGRVPNLRLAGSGNSYVRRSVDGRVPNLRLAGTGNSYVRHSVDGRVPKLRLAGSGKRYAGQSVDGRVPKLRLAGSGKRYVSRSAAGRVPKLRLSDARSRSLAAAVAAFSGGSQVALAGGRRKKLNFAGDLPVRGNRAVRTPGKNWLRPASSSASAVAKRPARGPARGWLGSAGTGGLISGRTAAGFAGSGRKGVRPRKFASGSLGARRGGTSAAGLRVPRTADEALAARSAPSGLSALAGAGTPVAGRAPQAGWLRSTRTASTLSVKRAPRRGWLGNSRRRPRTVIGSTPGTGRRPLGRRGAASGNWYTASPSGAWLRRGSHSWRKRSRRLLRMIGVGQ